MKKTFLLFMAISLVSCSVTKTGTAKTMEIVGSGVIHKPIIADLIVNEEKATATTTFSNVKSFESAKIAGVRKLLNDFSADVLVEPSFESTTKNGKTILTTTGWPANYKNFRTVEEKDIKLLEIKPGLIQKANVFEAAVETKKKNMGLWATLGALLIGGLIVSVL